MQQVSEQCISLINYLGYEQSKPAYSSRRLCLMFATKFGSQLGSHTKNPSSGDGPSTFRTITLIVHKSIKGSQTALGTRLEC
jgi:hypothetical protein